MKSASAEVSGRPLWCYEPMCQIAYSILRRERLVDRPLRLLGLGVNGLGPPGMQIQLPL